MAPASVAPRSRSFYLLLLALGTSVVCAVCAWFPAVMSRAGISHGGFWFRDTFYVLAAIDAKRLGMDPYGPNAMNVHHNYSHWWLWLEHTSLGRRDMAWMGALVAGLGLIAGWLSTRPRSAAELAWTWLFFCSPPLLLGLNRANVDWLLFALLALLVPAILASAPVVRRWGAPLLIALATGLKYYPAAGALLLLAMRPRPDRRFALWFSGGLIGLVLLNVAPDMARFSSVVEHEGFYVFGAAASFHKAGLPDGLALGFGIVVLLAAGGWLASRPMLRTWAVPAELRQEYLYFILGATLLSACFLLTTNYAYRWMFGLWLLPFLCRLQPVAPGLRRLVAVTRVLLLVQGWGEVPVIAWLNSTPVTKETVEHWEFVTTYLLAISTWMLFACLAGWLLHFLLNEWRSPESA